MKLSFEMLSHPNTLYAWVLCNKYRCDMTQFLVVEFKARDSNLWRGILKVWQIVLLTTGITNIDDANPPCWKISNDGTFFVKFANSLLACITNRNGSSLWKSIWRWNFSRANQNIFMAASQRELLTNELRTIRHLTSKNICPRCKLEVESCLHVVCDCPKVKDLWQWLVHPRFWIRFFWSWYVWLFINELKEGLSKN